mmetsp:Transcript_11531/g.19105  ORF Transcript_11531/g.19105 Transcript_11531/m.19105 type:complete len:106 (-) Transcript_11531:1494-1811(-)
MSSPERLGSYVQLEITPTTNCRYDYEKQMGLTPSPRLERSGRLINLSKASYSFEKYGTVYYGESSPLPMQILAGTQRGKRSNDVSPCLAPGQWHRSGQLPLQQVL